MDNIILHIDINNCFATIEMLQNPEWRGRALAVCGSPSERRGIILAKSEEAKKYGVKTGEAIWQAQRKCPDLLLVPPHFDLYRQYSHKTHEIYYRYTSQVEPFGIDECWLDVRNSKVLFGSPREIAEQIRTELNQELGITVSIGMSSTKVMAKLASDLAGVNEIRVITQADIEDRISHLPVDKMLGVGRSTGKILRRYGINTIGKLAGAPESFLVDLFGVRGAQIRREAQGVSADPVKDFSERETIKSVGNGCTCSCDLVNEEEVFRVFMALAKSVSVRLRRARLYAQGIQITVKDQLFSSYQKQYRLRSPLRLAQGLADQAMSLFKSTYDWRLPVRALTLRAYNLCHHLPSQLALNFGDDCYSYARLDDAIAKLRYQFGEDCIDYAGSTLEYKLPKNKYNLFAFE